MKRLNIQEIINKFGKKDNDTGSAPVQIALLTEKISALTEHLKTHKKDYISTTGLLKMVGQRKRLLNYYMKKDIENYNKLVIALGLRKSLLR